MHDLKNMFRSTFSNISFLNVLTDENFVVIDSTSATFLEQYQGKCIRDLFVSLPDNFKGTEIVCQAKIQSINYSADIIPHFNDEELRGYIVRFLSATDIFKFHKNIDYCNLVFNEHSEIRSQVSAIISSSMMIHDILENKELYNEIKYLNNLVNSCYKILSIIQNKSELAKYATGVFNITRLDVSSFTRSLVEHISNLTRYEKITLNFSCDDKVLIDIDADRYAIVLVNIIINAIMYNISEEKIVSISLKNRDGSAVLKVTDNGLGISGDKVTQLIEANHSFEINPNAMIESGCGYYIINCFCHYFNSSLILTSKENEGTTVSIKMPLSDGKDTPKYVESRTAEYLSNRFSSIYIALSKIMNIKFY